VSALTLPRNANIANNATNSAPRHEYAKTLLPNFVKLIKELLVVLDIPKL
jgi:hypothetical protein